MFVSMFLDGWEYALDELGQVGRIFTWRMREEYFTSWMGMAGILNEIGVRQRSHRGTSKKGGWVRGQNKEGDIKPVLYRGRYVGWGGLLSKRTQRFLLRCWKRSKQGWAFLFTPYNKEYSIH